MNKLELMKMANEIRKGAVTAVYHAKSGHPGGSLSAADIYTYLFFEEMNVDPADPKKADRDRFVLSKGHTAPGYYATLANRGFFPVEDLTTLRHVGSYLQGHSDRESQQQLEWRSEQSFPEMIIVYTRFLETERSRKGRCGKQPCLQDIEN